MRERGGVGEEAGVRVGVAGVRALAVFAALLWLLAALALTAAPASAAVTEFGSEGEGVGQFSEPHGVAVDNCMTLGKPCTALEDPSVGDAYVADRNNARVEKFGPDGEFLLAWGWGVANGEPELQTCGPDASPSTETCEPGVEGAGAGQFENPGGVAVDDSGGLSQGDVYVEDIYNHRVEKFTPNGQFVLMFGAEVNKAKDETPGATAEEKNLCRAGEGCKAGAEEPVPGAFRPLSPNAIAVDEHGTVFVGDESRVRKFTEGGVSSGEAPLAGCGYVGGLTVDSLGHLSVLCSELPGVHVYPETGSPQLREVQPAANYSNAAIALGPSGELFVDDSESARVGEYEPAGEQVASFPASPGQESVRGLAFGDGAGELFVLAQREAAAGGVSKATRVRLLGLPPAGPLVETEEASAGLMGTATVKASIDPEGKATEYHLDYGTEVANEMATAGVALAATEFAPETVEVKLTGLQPGIAYHFHFVATNENAPGGNAGPDETFASLPAVAIESESVSQVTALSARLQATINPLTLPTAYHFEYLTEAEFAANGDSFSGTSYKPISVPELPEPEGNAGSGSTGVPESVLIEKLSPGTTYFYRTSAHNTFGKTTGGTRTFTTQASEGPGLIDGRGWELVSPPVKHGAALEAITLEGGDIQAAANGGAVAYIAKAPVDAEPAGNRSFASQELLATHSGESWTTTDIATPHEGVAGLGGKGQSEYKLFSLDLSRGALEPEGVTPLSPFASERTPYVRAADACEPAGGETLAADCFTPLVSGCPSPPTVCRSSVAEHADVPAGTKFALQEENGEWLQGTGVEFDAATSDLSHVVLNAPQSLTAGFAGSAPGAREQSLYEWAEGALTPVSVLPDESSAVVEGGASLGDAGFSMRNAISADGGIVFFETVAKQHLYVRDMGRESTARLDVPEPGLGGVHGLPAVYQDASSDGERVFFSDEARLTADARSGQSVVGGGGVAPDLYMCEIAAVLAAGERDCSRHLSDLTVAANVGEPADVLGAVIGASVDGSYVYFVADGVLSNAGVPVAGAVRGDCPSDSSVHLPAGNVCNLYVWHDGTVRLVTVLSSADFPDWAGANLHDELDLLTARVSPNGRYLAFMSQRSLTGYDNHDALSGEPDEEVYEYDAVSERVVCVSCDPSGARPFGVLDPSSEEPSLLVDRPSAWSLQWLAASIPGWTPVQTSLALYQSRYLSNEGRLFFDSPVGLVPGDGNGRQDVYEYEPEGLGGCASSATSSTVAFKSAHTFQVPAEGGVPSHEGEEGGGCVGLISSGTSGEESAFLDASESGEDVFFLTAAKLSPRDTDSALDLYDAHVCSTVAPCPSGTLIVPPACSTAESCRAAPAPQPEVYGPPGTATFSGPANPPVPTPSSSPKKVTKKKVPRCKRGYVKAKVKKKQECVRAKTSHRKAKR